MRIWIDGPESRSTTIFVGPYPVDALRASPHIDPVVELLKSCTLLSFRELAVVGAYCRFSPEDRAALKTLVRRIRHSLKVKENCRANFLLWAPAGSGKTALIKEIALMEKVNFVEANLATSQEQFTDAIRKAINSKQPTLCLVDEIDAHAEERWPYESFFSYLEENLQRAHPLVFVMAGSAPNGIDSMIKGIEARFKGPDLISRIFDSDTRYCLPEHKMGDILIIFATRSMLHAKRLGRKIQGINKAVAYFLLRNVNYHRPRQLDELALRTVLRMTEDDEVMHFGHLFDPTDTNQYRFWHSHADSLDELAKSNIMLRP